ncbi:MAG: hypothetical protein A2511_17620 [Deltaproteobacteria bacterium RIFOXYD12_FULL_50_9]|nr:MAG: hypothetical protein A2511_17620 [Deltaproteobacteria bacterium RIFOXYD12_FULL_50_9]
MQSMSDSFQDASERLSEVFARINMSELPAMSSHVRELISLTSDGRSSANELAEIILKDYSLSNKVLQVVNSAFYALPQPVTSITRAITHLGFDAIRDLALPIALFENFVKSGVEKEGITKILSSSFLSALFARGLVQRKGLKLAAEEVFICALFRNLGKMIICIYFPDMYRDIENKMARGMTEDEATQVVFEGLTLSQVGIEVARFWNLSDKIVVSMTPDPPPPEAISEELGLLNNLADYANRLVEAIARELDAQPIMEKYDELFSLNNDDLINLLKSSMQAAEGFSSPIRYGLGKLKMVNRIMMFENALKSLGAKTVGKSESESDLESQLPAELGTQGGEPDVSSTLAGLEEKFEYFMAKMTEIVAIGGYNLNDFYQKVLEGFGQVIGVDYAVLALIKVHSTRVSLVGKLGYGELPAIMAGDFRHDIYSPMQGINPVYVIPRALKTCKDLAIPANTQNVFPADLDAFVKNRHVYLLPICINMKPVGLFFLTRRMELPRLNNQQLKAARHFRDLAVTAIRKKHE